MEELTVDESNCLALLVGVVVYDGRSNSVAILERQTRPYTDQDGVTIDVGVGCCSRYKCSHQGATDHDQDATEGVVRSIAARHGHGGTCNHDGENGKDNKRKEADGGLNRAVTAGELKEKRDVVERNAESCGGAACDDKEEEHLTAGEEADGEQPVGFAGEDTKVLLDDEENQGDT